MFDINDPQDLIKIYVFDKDFEGETDYRRDKGDDFLGRCFIGLEMLRD